MKVAMQPQHSCGTLESRNKIFGCTVQELYITFYPLDHYPLLNQGMCTHRRRLMLHNVSRR